MFCGTFYCFIMFHHVSWRFIIAPSEHGFRLGIDLPTRSIFFGHGVRFFNTNNLWVDLVALKREFRRNDGALPLPVMKRIGEWMGMGGSLQGNAWYLVENICFCGDHISHWAQSRCLAKLCHVVFSWEDAVVSLWLSCCATIEARASHDRGQPPDFTETILFQQLPNIWPDPITLHNHVWIRINPKYCIYLYPFQVPSFVYSVPLELRVFCFATRGRWCNEECQDSGSQRQEIHGGPAIGDRHGCRHPVLPRCLKLCQELPENMSARIGEVMWSNVR